MENIEYTEWVPAGALVKGLFVMISLIVVVVTFAFFFFSEGLLFEDILGISFAWVVLAILLLVFWNYRSLHIKINDENLSVNYGRFDITPKEGKVFVFSSGDPDRECEIINQRKVI